MVDNRIVKDKSESSRRPLVILVKEFESPLLLTPIFGTVFDGLDSLGLFPNSLNPAIKKLLHQPSINSTRIISFYLKKYF